MCGYDNTPLFGTGCVNDPWDAAESPQNVCGQCGILFDVTYPIGTVVV